MGKFGKNLAEMIGKSEKNPQLDFLKVPLVSIINMNHELVELSRRIDWESANKDFEDYYHYTGRPGVPVRKMVGSMLLKQMYNLSDESYTARGSKIPTGNTSVVRLIFSLRSHLIRVSLFIFANV